MIDRLLGTSRPRQVLNEATKTTRFAHHINDHAHPSFVAISFKVETSTADVGVLTLRNICTRAWHLFDTWTCISRCDYRGKNQHFGFGASFAKVGGSWSCNVTFRRMICFHTLVSYNGSNFFKAPVILNGNVVNFMWKRKNFLLLAEFSTTSCGCFSTFSTSSWVDA